MKKPKRTRLVLLGVGILLVLLGLRGVALGVVGKTARATVTEVKEAIISDFERLFVEFASILSNWRTKNTRKDDKQDNGPHHSWNGFPQNQRIMMPNSSDTLFLQVMS